MYKYNKVKFDQANSFIIRLYSKTKNYFFNIQRIIYITLMLGYSIISTAQTGKIVGQVIDKDTSNKETIIGAYIGIQGLNVGSATDIDGNFEIANVPPGNYNLSVSYVGYKTFIQKVVVVANEATKIKVLIENEGRLSEVEVVGTKITQTERAVLKEMKISTSVISGISREQITRGQDRDAADVAKRVSGVTMVENKFVMVRGIPERYNTVWVNDASTPSYEQESKIFSFDNLPSAVIDRMILYKSPAPELPGDFAGGFVKIYTLGIPAENSFKIGGAGSFRPNTTFKDISLPVKGKYDWLGYNDGTYKLNKDVPLDGMAEGGNKYDWIKVGKLFNNNWTPEQGKAPVDARFNLSLLRRFKLGNSSILGTTTTINYANTYQKYIAHREHLFAFKSGDLGSNQPVYSLVQNYNNRTARLGVMQNFGIQIGANHTIQFKNFYSQQANYQYFNMEGNFNAYSGSNFLNHTAWNYYRSIYSGQLLGNHKLGPNTQLDWGVSYSKAQREDPDIKRYTERVNLIDRNDRNLIIPAEFNPNYFGRIFFRTNEDLKTARTDIQHTILIPTLPFLKPELKAGIYLEERKRQFRIKLFAYDDKVETPQSGVYYNTVDINKFTINDLNSSTTWNNFNGLVMKQVEPGFVSYDGVNTLSASYGGINLPFGKTFNIYTGVRVENNILTVVGTSHVVSVLPSVNMNYKFSEKTQLRASYGKTVNRPEFREFSKLSFFDFTLNKNVSGNPNLQMANIHNFEMRFEHYPKAGENINFGVFYKRITNPIEQVLDPNTADLSITFANASSAYCLGAEIELSRSLSNILSMENQTILKNIVLIANGSLVKSEVDLRNTLNKIKRPLMGQAPYTINGGIAYTIPDYQIITNLTYNVIGKRLFIADFPIGGTYNYGSIYEMGRHIIDFTITKKIGKHIEIKGGIQDLLNQRIQFVQDANLDNNVGRIKNPSILGNGTNGQKEPVDGEFWGYKLGSYYTLGVNIVL